MATDDRTAAQRAYDAWVTHEASAWWDPEYTWDEKLDTRDEDQFDDEEAHDGDPGDPS